MIEAIRVKSGFFKFDRVVVLVLLGYGLIAAVIPDIFSETVLFTASAMIGTAPFITFAVLAVAYLKATGAEALVASAFKGAHLRMILFASLLGGLSPFCSCEVIPFIAALLAVGVPLSAVMAFWLSSPLMDPAMFAITSGTLGFEFAIANSKPNVPLVMANMAGSIKGDDNQKAITALNGTPTASKAAINGITSHEQNGDNPPSNDANRIMRR